MAAKENIGSWLAAWLCPLLFLLAAVAAAPTASALTPGTLETRVGQKSFAALETRQAEPFQAAGLHQENASPVYDFAPESLLAAETAIGEAKFLGQGFDQAQARYLAQPYEGMGHHFLRREWGLPQAITDSRFSVLKPSGINRGNFYELHYRVDPSFYGVALPKSLGGSWSGSAIGLEKHGFLGRMWYGSPTPLKVGVGGASAIGGAGVYWYLNNGD